MSGGYLSAWQTETQDRLLRCDSSASLVEDSLALEDTLGGQVNRPATPRGQRTGMLLLTLELTLERELLQRESLVSLHDLLLLRSQDPRFVERGLVDWWAEERVDARLVRRPRNLRTTRQCTGLSIINSIGLILFHPYNNTYAFEIVMKFADEPTVELRTLFFRCSCSKTMSSEVSLATR